jgi:hypothetical protein
MERTIVEVNGRRYQVGRLPALTQLHVARKLMPCIAGLSKLAPKIQGMLPGSATEDKATDAMAEEVIGEVVGSVGAALSSMSDEDVEYIVKTCLKVCYAEQAGTGGWAPMANSQGLIMDANLELPDLLRVTMEVVKENLGGFFRGGPAS